VHTRTTGTILTTAGMAFAMLFAGPASAAVAPRGASPRGLALPGVALRQAAAPALAGWRPIFSADFSGTSLPGQCWAYDGPHDGSPQTSAYNPDQVRVSGGLLRLGMAVEEYKGRKYSTGGLGCFKIEQVYGRYEFRAKAPLGAGIDAYMTLWPQTQNGDDATLLEIIPKPGNEKMHLTNGYGSASGAKILSGGFSDAFHTYTLEWSPKLMRVLIDGVVRFSEPHASTKRRWLAFAVSSGDNLTGLPDSATTLPAEFQFDWLRMWAYDPSVKASPTATKPSASRSASPSGSGSASSAAAPAGQARLAAAEPADSTNTDAAGDRSGLAGSGLGWALTAVAGLLVLGAVGYVLGFTLRRRRRGGG
jgi:beta-glucanase (GH16 family)